MSTATVRRRATIDEVATFARSGHGACYGRGYLRVATRTAAGRVPCACAARKFLRLNPGATAGEGGALFWPPETVEVPDAPAAPRPSLVREAVVALGIAAAVVAVTLALAWGLS